MMRVMIMVALMLVSGCEQPTPVFPSEQFSLTTWARFYAKSHSDVPPFEAMLAPQGPLDLVAAHKICIANGWRLIAPYEWQDIESVPAPDGFVSRGPDEWVTSQFFYGDPPVDKLYTMDRYGNAIERTDPSALFLFRCSRDPQN